MGTAVEELLRFDGPVQRTARIPSEDVTIGGRIIPKGELVMPFIGAADRDPAQFPDPERLDITRTDNRHIAFGWGIHFCLGRAAGAHRGADRHRDARPAAAQSPAGHGGAGVPAEPHAARTLRPARHLLVTAIPL